MIILTCSVMPPGMAVRRSTPKGLSVAWRDGRDLGGHLRVAHGGRTEAAEAAGLRDGGGQLGVGDTPHAGQHDGVLDAEQLGEACSHDALAFLVSSVARPVAGIRRGDRSAGGRVRSGRPTGSGGTGRSAAHGCISSRTFLL